MFQSLLQGPNKRPTDRDSPTNLAFLQTILSNFFVKIRDQNFRFVRTFVFREITKFLFTHQVWQFAYILLQKVLNCTQFSYIWITFWPKSLEDFAQNPQWRSLQCSLVPPSCWKNSQNFCRSLLKKIIQTLCWLNCDDGNLVSWKTNSEMC